MTFGILDFFNNPQRGRQIEKRVESILNDIKAVPGIQGVFLLSPQGDVLYPPNAYESPVAKLIAESAGDIDQTLALFELTGHPLQELQLTFSKGILLLYNQLGIQVRTAQGLQQACLLIPCAQNVNRPHLRMVLKVAVMKLRTQRLNGRGQRSASLNGQACLERATRDPGLNKLLDTLRGY